MKTNYPFGDEIQFTIEVAQNTSFPLHLRIPQWCKHYSLEIKVYHSAYFTVSGEVIMHQNRRNFFTPVLEKE
jgi:DUF1680 family protein